MEIRKSNVIHAVFIIDESGSMAARRQDTIDGFNKELANLAKEQNEFGVQYMVTLVTFNTGTIPYKYIYKDIPLSEVDNNFALMYRPAGGTPLLETVGSVISDIEPTNPNVMVTIITDGEENSSKGEYADSTLVKNIITECEKNRQWAFCYLGANQDVWSEAGKLGVSNVLEFDTLNSSSYANAFLGTKNARSVYTSNIVQANAGSMLRSEVNSNLFGSTKHADELVNNN